jgi:hypothetical protein
MIYISSRGRFYGLEIVWIEIHPQVTGTPEERLCEKISVDIELSNYSASGWVLFASAVVSQARAQLDRFPLGPAVRRSGMVAFRTTEYGHFA